MWTTSDVAPLDAASIRELADGRVPALRLADFATGPECRALATALTGHAIRTRSVEAVTRLGISQYQQGLCGSKAEYFGQAAELRPHFDAIFEASFDPLERILSHLRALGFDADIMHEPGMGPYWAGSGKLRNGATPLHVDFAPQDSAGWAIEETTAQLAWNLYLDLPEPGALQVWDRQWERADDQFQASTSYSFSPAVVAGARRVDIEPVVGEVLLLNSGFFHSVAPTSHRLTFGSFLSMFADGSIRLWS